MRFILRTGVDVKMLYSFPPEQPLSIVMFLGRAVFFFLGVLLRMGCFFWSFKL